MDDNLLFTYGLGDIPRARKDHPDTSHEAAKNIKLGKDMRFALDAISAHPGRTAGELDYLFRCTTGGKIRKRLNDLRLVGKARKGEKRKCSITGRTAYTWYAT